MNLVINPLRERSQFCSLDIQSGQGIDFSANLYEDSFFLLMKFRSFDGILLCNVIENIDIIEELVSWISELIKLGGYNIVTELNEYPIHYDKMIMDFNLK